MFQGGGEAKDSAFLSSPDTVLLEPTEWTQGCRASSSVWREDPGLLSRPGRKRRPSSRDDGGVSWVSSGCYARGGFLPRHDEDLREPLVRRPEVMPLKNKIAGTSLADQWLRVSPLNARGPGSFPAWGTSTFRVPCWSCASLLSYRSSFNVVVGVWE